MIRLNSSTCCNSDGGTVSLLVPVGPFAHLSHVRDSVGHLRAAKHFWCSKDFLADPWWHSMVDDFACKDLLALPFNFRLSFHVREGGVSIAQETAGGHVDDTSRVAQVRVRMIPGSTGHGVDVSSVLQAWRG